MGGIQYFFLPWSHYNTDRPWAALSSDLEDCYCGNSDFVCAHGDCKGPVECL